MSTFRKRLLSVNLSPVGVQGGRCGPGDKENPSEQSIVSGGRRRGRWCDR